MDWNSFQTAYKNATADTRSVIDSPILPECVEELVGENKILESQQVYVLRVLSHKVLGTVTDSEAVEALIAQNIPQASEVMTTLQNQVAEKKHMLFHSNPATEENVLEAQTVTSHSVPAGLRTMATDVEQVKHPERETTYTSSQEALLREGRNKGA